MFDIKIMGAWGDKKLDAGERHIRGNSEKSETAGKQLKKPQAKNGRKNRTKRVMAKSKRKREED